jgi:hypothetical protein
VEGDEFANKENFVMQAYKDQMAGVRGAEEEEKREGIYFSIYLLLFARLHILPAAARDH